MRLSVVLLIVLVSVTVLEASPYGQRAKERLPAWKPKALREKEAAERLAQEKAAAEAEAKALEEAKKAAEVKVVDEVKVEELPKTEDQALPVASEAGNGESVQEQDPGQEQPMNEVGEQVLQTSVIVADSPVVDTVVPADAPETSTEPAADTTEIVPESAAVTDQLEPEAASVAVADQLEPVAAPVAEEPSITA